MNTLIHVNICEITLNISQPYLQTVTLLYQLGFRYSYELKYQNVDNLLLSYMSIIGYLIINFFFM